MLLRLRLANFMLIEWLELCVRDCLLPAGGGARLIMRMRTQGSKMKWVLYTVVLAVFSCGVSAQPVNPDGKTLFDYCKGCQWGHYLLNSSRWFKLSHIDSRSLFKVKIS